MADTIAIETLSPAEVFARADRAARAAVAKAASEMSDMQGCCGFAWVTVKPATSPFVRWCKKNGHGDKHWHSGWWLSNPGHHRGQRLDIIEAGAKAFSEELQRLGIDASWSSRLD